jgi:hypothetical protein
LKIGWDFARALLMYDVDGFAARLSKQRRQQQSFNEGN